MLAKNEGVQGKVIVTTLEGLMPKEHFLRDLEGFVDFSFIYDRVKHLYSSVGRPSVDPVVLVKMLLIGFLYGIDSERRIEREAQVNIAYRWFLGIGFDERIPDHSTISQTRRRKFRGSSIFEGIFYEVVKKCIEVGLVDGSLILTDSTHVKASASSKRSEVLKVAVDPSDYVKGLDRISEEEDLKVRAEAIARGRKKRGRPIKAEPKTKLIRTSKTDPDSGYMNRPDKPQGFHYLSHQSSDGKSGIITDVYVTPGNVNDCVPYVLRIKYQKERYNFPIKEVGIDQAYDQIEIHKEMHDLGIKTFAPIRKSSSVNRNVFSVNDFAYNETKDAYVCPAGNGLRYVSVNKTNRSKSYAASTYQCSACHLKPQCLGGKQKRRTIDTPFFQEIANKQRQNSYTERYYEIQRLRQIYCEGNFATQKECHNLRRTRKRGNKNVTEHCLLSALALNLKRLVKYLKGQPTPALLFRFFALFPRQHKTFAFQSCASPF
jgi:transposase